MSINYLKKFCYTGNTHYLKYINKSTELFMIPAAKVALEEHFPNSYYYNRAISIIDTFTPVPPLLKCVSLTGPSNIGNTCYMDSVLFAMFAIPNIVLNNLTVNSTFKIRYTEDICGKNINQDLIIRTDINNSIKKLVKSMHTKNISSQISCYNLKQKIKKCKRLLVYYGDAQQDAGEFLTHIIDIYDDINVAEKATTTYVTNNITEYNTDNMKIIGTVTDKKASIIKFVDAITLSFYGKNVDIRTFLSSTEDSGVFTKDNLYYDENRDSYIRRIAKESIVSTPYLIFNIQRLNPIDGKKSKIKIYPSEIITLPISGQRFSLSAIVVHLGGSSGGHYIAYIRCENKWLLYDDMEDGIEEIGTFKNLVNQKITLTSGTLYFYTPFPIYEN